jgi:two-component system, chemotaxis family, response regulator Rcp1
MNLSRPIRILVAEDNAADAYLLRKALSCEFSNCELQVLGDGDEAFRFLSRLDPYRQAPRPDIIVLDLNLPKRDGLELLQLIRNSEELRNLPVAVLSSAPEDLARPSLQQADCYIKKPMDLDAYLAIGRSVMECYHAAHKSGPEQTELSDV